MVDDRLEGGRCVSQPKGYDIVLEVPVAYPERRLLLVSFFNTDIGVRSREIETREDTRACQLVSKLRDERQGVAVLYHLIIQLSVVHVYPELSVLFGDEENRVSRRRY